jgi:hypothetical protein
LTAKDAKDAKVQQSLSCHGPCGEAARLTFEQAEISPIARATPDPLASFATLAVR